MCDPMISSTSVQDVVDQLARDPLPHIVLLKHLLAYPEHVRVHRVVDGAGAATLVLLEARVSPYDRETYPKAAVAAFISSGHPALTAPSHRRRGLGARVVRTALAELAERGLIPRYQVEAHNTPSIGLAETVGPTPFLTIVHYAHHC
jgi:GNAT superfamily N-acetyltransferase